MNNQDDYVYDYVIVGAGPCGLTLASLLKGKVLLIEKDAVIGGCHRVERQDAIFTEHAPRVYSSAFKNFIHLMEYMGMDFYKMFKEYRFSIANMNRQSLGYFDMRELGILALDFLKLTIVPSHGTVTSMSDYCILNGFSEEARDYIDRVCRLSDGSDYTRYSLNHFLNIPNQHAFYKLYQPTAPNDSGLMLHWQAYIDGLPTHKTLLNASLESVDVVRGMCVINGSLVAFKKLIFAVPPIQLVSSIERIGLPINMFGENLKEFADITGYAKYVSCTFCWRSAVINKNVQGFPMSEWGVVFVTVSDYWEDKQEYKTVISASATILTTKSKRLGKTVLECSKDEILLEIFIQIKDALRIHEPPNKAVISDTGNTSFFNSIDNIRSKGFPTRGLGIYKNVYNIGTHSGMSEYRFTSMESAVTNAIQLCNNEFAIPFPVKKAVMLVDVLRVVQIILIISVIGVTFLKKY